MSLLYASTLFLSAALLFLVEPMFAKMVLPLLRGSPAVWNTCMVFYQAAVLAGYVYAHLSMRRFGHRLTSSHWHPPWFRNGNMDRRIFPTLSPAHVAPDGAAEL